MTIGGDIRLIIKFTPGPSYRILNSEVVQLGSLEFKLYFGDKVYIGSEQILNWGYAFILPKASPLKAGFDSVTFCGARFSIVLQESLLMAVAWWKDTGISAKMLSDVLVANQDISIPKVRTNIPLSFWHISPPLLMLGIGLVTAIIVFCFEKMTSIQIIR